MLPSLTPRPLLRLARHPLARTVHAVAAQGFTHADAYDAARPSYPPAALALVRALLPPAARVIEPGAGTGIFSRLLAQGGVRALVAVEPSSEMRAAWARGMRGKQGDKIEGKQDGKPDLRCVDGGFDNLSRTGWGRGDKAEADAVIIAQAWHWCMDYDRALAEIADYLKPHAPLVLIWNLESDADAFHRDLRAAYQAHDLGSPQYYRGLWRQMFETPAYHDLFASKEEHRFAWDVGIDEDAVVARIMSKSYMTMLGDKHDEVVAQLRRIIRQSDKEWIDQPNGTFRYRYNTDVVVLRKR
ncbi:S-adenosyl-L-methionine-dependent methyltransferase [Cutaneotrichosporon oleaginosum]|uniref:S-adenosyl-L-methionine-dependent methyltransferase n=1 Tax=Cutaneotrichosporon oleaginosum TaxID=879819 RepID=A0A0J0XVB1_9TREE|nr:S-adenosyl-L-methionine-dependent methyltransferase [Cutaneotrichosporon oleaginosum]KLT44996.1 S-adenosyl-L-methionine-dependent methyltransferase [Cutaneotrichosporon oleaginosum]TXT09684.1 hypothetical protein COLE_03618 [Cutaneotrichosporon oleaginosum]